VVKVHRDEDIANRIDPESCAGTREGAGEALTGECVGQPLSRESLSIRMPTLSHWWKALRALAISRANARSCVVIDPGMHRSSLHGNREISSLAACLQGAVRIGKARSRSR
jgi:hypothetical protein